MHMLTTILIDDVERILSPSFLTISMNYIQISNLFNQEVIANILTRSLYGGPFQLKFVINLSILNDLSCVHNDHKNYYSKRCIVFKCLTVNLFHVVVPYHCYIYYM